MSSPVARRYAQALLADAESDVSAVAADLATVATTVRESRDLRLMLGSPIVPRDKKRRVVEGVFGSTLRPRALAFLGFLFDKEREGMIGDVAEAFAALVDEQNGVETATVRVPAALGAAEEARLKTALEAQTGKTLRLDVTADPDMIGGIVVRIGDTVYDGSLRFRLDALRERLMDGVLPN